MNETPGVHDLIKSCFERELGIDFMSFVVSKCVLFFLPLVYYLTIQSRSELCSAEERKPNWFRNDM